MRRHSYRVLVNVILRAQSAIHEDQPLTAEDIRAKIDVARRKTAEHRKPE